jgi:hypothetical protein
MFKCEKCKDEFFIRLCPSCQEGLEDEELELKKVNKNLKDRCTLIERIIRLRIEKEMIEKKIDFLKSLLEDPQ